MKVIFSGLESSGKSLMLAITAGKLVERNARWERITGKKRPILSNMHFSDDFVDWAIRVKKVQLSYWHSLDELVRHEEADILCDEVGNYFDSRMWTELSLDVRRWLTQGAKRGIEFYGGAQDFAQVDKAFRRLVQPGDLQHITKICGSRRPSATKPAVKNIWGVCMMRGLNPQGYNEDKKKFDSSSLIPHFFFIRKEHCQIFDTSEKIVRGKLPPLRHRELECELDSCAFKKTIHV